MILILGGAEPAHAGTFNPEMRFCLEDFSTFDPNPTLPGDPAECDGVNSAGAASDFSVGLDILSGDVNFGGVVTYIPNEWHITRGDEFPIGTRVGLLEALATIGIINGACDNGLNLTGLGGFELYNSSLDITDTIDFDTETELDDTIEDWAEDLDGDGLKEFITKYPDWNNRIITDENDNPQQPIRRSAGHLIIAGAQVIIQFLIYEPGTFISKHLTNDPELGYPSVVLLQNAGDPDIVPEPGPITDFCTPLSSTTTNWGKGDACQSVINDDEDDDELINDGCPELGLTETLSECILVNRTDDDEDGVVNDGCPEQEGASESGADCENDVDDDDDGFTNDGCPAVDDPETDAIDECDNIIDDDRNDDLDFTRAEGREEARVNDGCPQAGDTSEGDIEYTLYTNPDEEGSYTFTTIAIGQPDTDGDGIENNLDTCPYDQNAGDPRIKGDGDLDVDGLDAVCDPDDDEINSDQDLDGYVNRQDNCPLAPNGEDATNQDDEDVDEDGEDMADGIGDDCDQEPLVFNGEPVPDRMRTLTMDVEIGPPAAGETPTEGETPTADETPAADGEEDEDDDGGGAAVVIIIIVVVAAVVVVGGGAFYFMRRGGSGSGT